MAKQLLENVGMTELSDQELESCSGGWTPRLGDVFGPNDKPVYEDNGGIGGVVTNEYKPWYGWTFGPPEIVYEGPE